ncbi:MAG: ABC transporter ATP-binding protein [Candidatus Methanomethylicia archaeon]
MSFKEIIVSDLSFSYGRVEALRKISFTIRGGEFIGILGPNGSGKTTLLKCLCSLLKPYGSIYIDGTSIYKYSAREIARMISYIPPTPLPGGLSVFDTVSLGRTPHMKGLWWESREDEDLIQYSLKSLNLDGLADRRVCELSSGEQQRVKIAKAITQQPKILLVDEPTVHLDLKHQVEIMDILKSLTYKGLAVIAALHDLNLALTYSDKVVVLNSGRIVAYGDPKVILTEELIERVYGVKVKIMWDNELNHPVITILKAG